MTEKSLTEREELILQAVVHLHITSAEPVGSRAIVKRYQLDISPATVRNVMSDLEEQEYIHQVHTSSGRVPTDKGYRYYVDYLMNIQEITLSERSRYESELNERLSDADVLLKQTSTLLALLSHQAGIVEAPSLAVTEISRVDLMPMGGNRAALLIADNYGQVRTLVIPVIDTMSTDGLQKMNNFLNTHLKGTSVENISTRIESVLHDFVDEQRALAEQAAQLLHQISGTQTGGQLFLEGATQLFEQPEFQQIDRAREVFGLLEEEDKVMELLRAGITSSQSQGARVIIGSEAHEHGIDEVSVVSAPYQINGKTVGMVGVLGPRRMPYSKLTGIVDYTAARLSRLFSTLSRT
ncbi:MAG: heat-inducible transcription repressor HrcA [Candidatus Hydrogenedentota bacterium]|nr:MAG: heat-inducible transcription repressor HrcA [Candidatus Hydrogenedentota bacterium]